MATTAMFVFTAGVLLASAIHRNLFSAALATWLWFGGFTIATLFLGLLTARAFQLRPDHEALASASAG